MDVWGLSDGEKGGKDGVFRRALDEDGPVLLEIIGAAVAVVDGLEAGGQWLVVAGVDGDGVVGAAVGADAAADVVPAGCVGAGCDVADSLLEEADAVDDVVDGAHGCVGLVCVCGFDCLGT